MAKPSRRHVIPGSTKRDKTVPKPPSRSIHDRAAEYQHAVLLQRVAEIAAQKHGRLPPISLELRLLRSATRYARFCGNTSKYSPHQGSRERTRRAVRAIELR